MLLLQDNRFEHIAGEGVGEGVADELESGETVAVLLLPRAPDSTYLTVRRGSVQNLGGAIGEATRAIEHAKTILESGSTAFAEQQLNLRSSLQTVRKVLEEDHGN
jgi:hypothetical protein